MALRFKRSIFWCWEDDGEVRALIGLTKDHEMIAPHFRDRLADYLSVEMDMSAQFDRYITDTADGVIFLSNTKGATIDNCDFQRHKPTLLERLFASPTRDVVECDPSSMLGLHTIAVETNHDFPGLLIFGISVSIQALCNAIKIVGDDLGLVLVADAQLENIEIYSNRLIG